MLSNPWRTTDRVIAGQLNRIETMLSAFLNTQELIMVDTSRILAAVAAEKTKVDSLITLVNAQNDTMKALSAQLAAAIAANDPAALAKVQADLDKASNDLDSESASVQTAIDANTPAPAPAAAPADATPTPPDAAPAG
jgi:fatty acid-binding protein DegV